MIGVVSLVVLLRMSVPVAGVVFVAAIAAYTLIRQGLFPLRVGAHTHRGRLATSAASALALSVALSTLLL